jgi:zinc protease
MSRLIKKLFSVFIGVMLPLFCTLKAQIQSINRQGAECIYLERNNDITAIRIYFKGGFISDPVGKEGLNALLLELLLRSGTQQLDSAQFRRSLDSMFLQTRWELQPDNAVIQIELPAQYTEKACALLSQWLINPGWDSNMFKRVKEERIATLDYYKPTTIERLEFLSRNQAYRNSVYGRPPTGSSQSIEGISLSDIKTFYKNNYVKSAMLLTVVSPHNANEVEQWIADPFSKIPLGLYEEIKVGAFKPLTQSKFQLIRDSSDIPAFSGYFHVPAANTEEGLTAFVLAGMLDRMLRSEILLQRGMEADIRCNYHFMKNPGISIYIQSPEIQNVAMILKNLLNRLATDGFSAEETALYKSRLLTILYSGLQENMAMATHMGTWNLCADLQTLNALQSSIAAISPSALQAFLKQYLRHPHWTYVGLPTLLQENDLKLAY